MDHWTHWWELLRDFYLYKNNILFKVHIEEKPFTCIICEKVFSQSSKLRRHRGRVKGILAPWWSEENIFKGLKNHFLQFDIYQEILRRLITRIWLFTRMYSSVFLQITTEVLGTLITRIWFSPESILKCLSKLPLSEKSLGHWLQEYSFSLDCILECFFNLPLLEKSMGHWLQGYDFSHECILKCFFNLPFSEKTLGH